MADYSIRFDGCSMVPDFEREEGLRGRLLAKFKLCPTSSCDGKCNNAGEYVVELREFIESYQEAQREANEYECESAQQTCEYSCQNGQYNYNNNNNGNNNNQNNNNGNNNNNGENDEEYCQYQCLVEAGMSFCNEDQGQQEGMDMNEIGECRPMDEENGGNNNQNQYYYMQNGNNNNAYQTYYVGAYCTSTGVYAGTFTDSTCTTKAPSGTFESKYGYSLPTDPLVTHECLSCKASYNNNGNNNNNNNNGNNNNNNNNGNYVLETCQELYEQAGRCEKNMKSDNKNYQDNSACTLIHTTLARLDRAFSNATGRGPPASVILAWLFAVGLIFMGLYIHVLRRRLTRSNVNLSSSGDGVTA